MVGVPQEAKANVMPMPVGDRTPRRKWGPAAYEVAALLCGVVVWQIMGMLNPHLVASFTRVLGGGLKLAQKGVLWTDVQVTVVDMLVGFLGAVLIGVPLGCLMGLNQGVNRIAEMYLNWLLAVPEVAFIPFFVILFGLGVESRLMVVFVFALPVIVQNTRAGIVSVSTSLVEMGISFEVPRWDQVVKIFLPGSLPLMLEGIRMGLGRSLMGVVAAGFFIQMAGLGGMVYLFQNNFQLGRMFFGVLCIVIVGLLASRAIQAVNRRLTRWKKDLTTT